MSFHNLRISKLTEEKIVETFFPGEFPNWKRVAVALLALMIALLAVACGGSSAASKNEHGEKPAQQKVVSTTAVTVAAKDVPKYIEATGTFIADESTEVAPEVSGKVASTAANEGSFVRQGDVIVRLSEKDAQLRLQQARAAEQQAEAQLQQAEAQYRQAQAAIGLDKGGNFSTDNVPDVRQARAALRSAESDLRLAEANERRYANLLESGDTSRLVFDQRRNEAEKARATVGEARERLQAAENAARQSNQGIEASRAGVANARAAVESARSNTALAEKAVVDTAIRAPFAGFVSSRPVAVGEYVSPSSPVVTIVRTSPLKLRLQIPETEAGKVRVGMSVSASVAAFADRNFAGTIAAINPSLNENARSLLVEAIFENTENLLRPGMFATARVLQPEGEQGIYIPRTALAANTNTDSLGVYVIENDTARLRVIQIDGNTPEESGEVRVNSGLNSGDRIATTNLNELFDGAKIQ
jgi:RND family efflux transporter MFP subunit